MAAKKAKADLTNPVTGKGPNQFTQVTGRELPKPKAPHDVPVSRYAGTRQAAHREATAPGGSNAEAAGYARPEGMSPGSFSWVTGAHHMFPNQGAEHGTPAINEPHEPNPHITVQRRYEDLSGPEAKKAGRVLSNYGHDPKDPIGSLTSTQGQAIDRVVGEHAMHGVQENASQHFYGGAPITSKIPDQALQQVHNEGVGAAHNRFEQGVLRIADHPAFAEHGGDLTAGEYENKARGVMGQATADTSPNSKWRTSHGWPNMEQAEESVAAGLENRKPKFISGRVQAHDKAAQRAVEMTRSDASVSGGNGWAAGSIGESANQGEGAHGAHVYGNPYSAAKTVAFKGGLIDPNSPDAYKTADIHEAGVIAPGLPYGKGQTYRPTRGDGPAVVHHADQPASHVRGMKPVMDPKKKNPTVLAGNSAPEEMLGAGASYVHAANDYATRQALTDRGLSRGVNYADNLHATQGATWGSRQVERHDVSVSDANQYPVTRNWAAEGHSNLNEMGRSMMGSEPSHMGPQFVKNPNTQMIDRTGKGAQRVTHSKPYPVMPGEA